MLCCIRKLHVGALQFKVSATLKECTWHTMPLLPTLDVAGLKIAVTTFQTVLGKINFVTQEFLMFQVFYGSKNFFSKENNISLTSAAKYIT